MVSLPNGCKRSDISVIPSNWNDENLTDKAKKVLLKKNWIVTYRFYDPAYKGTKLWGKPFQNKGMNTYKTLEERRDFTESLIAEFDDLLKNEGYNPITKIFIPPESETEI